MKDDDEGRKKYTHEEWNDVLEVFAAQFADAHAESTVLIYSSYATFTRVLDDPTAYGFKTKDVSNEGGSIWCDRAHPTSKMHDEIAKDMIAFLSDVPKATSKGTAE